MGRDEVGWRADRRRLGEIAALSGLALVQPTLDVLGRSPETFIYRRVEGLDLVLFTVGMAVLPALVLWGLGLASGVAGSRVRRVVHAVTLVALLFVAAVLTLKSTETAFGTVAVGLAVLISAVAVALYRRFRIARETLLYLSVLPLLAAASFLVFSPSSGLVGGGGYEIVDDPHATRPVVMLVLDEFPTAEIVDADGAVDTERFPNLARLSQASRWYRNYTTVNNFTTHAVPALLSGEEPQSDQAPLVTDHPHNLFTFLGGTYDINVSEAVTRLCPAELCPTEGHDERSSGLVGVALDAVDVVRELASPEETPEPETDYFIEPVDDQGDETFEHDQDLAVVPTRLRSFLDDLEPTDGPSLHYLHLVLPHEPWRFLPDGTEYAPPSRDPRGDPLGRWSSEWSARLGRFRAELQARYVDALVGRVLDRLQETDLWDDAVITLVSDHGGSFIDGEGRRVLTEGNAHEILWSLLFVRAPDLEIGTTDVNMVSIDLLPTLAELLGTTLPWPVDGRSILPVDDGSEASTEGTKLYHRFTNRHFYEPEAVLHVAGPENFERMLARDHPLFDPDEPFASLYRDTIHGELYDRRVEDLEVGQPLPSSATVSIEDLDRIREGGDGVLAAYVGGGIESELVDDGDWVVITVDGVVSGLSPLFPEERHRRGFYVLLDPARVGVDGTDIDTYVVGDRGDELRPIEAVGE